MKPAGRALGWSKGKGGRGLCSPHAVCEVVAGADPGSGLHFVPMRFLYLCCLGSLSTIIFSIKKIVLSSTELLKYSFQGKKSSKEQEESM